MPYRDRVRAWWQGVQHAYHEAKHDLPPSRQIVWRDDRLNDAYDAGCEAGEMLAIPAVLWRNVRLWWVDFRDTYLP